MYGFVLNEIKQPKEAEKYTSKVLYSILQGSILQQGSIFNCFCSIQAGIVDFYIYYSV
jgi:hypothetical protein